MSIEVCHNPRLEVGQKVGQKETSHGAQCRTPQR